MVDAPGNGDGRCCCCSGGSPIGILSKPPTPKGLCSGMDMGDDGSTAMGCGGTPLDSDGWGGAGGGGGGGGGCRFNRECMLNASGNADRLPPDNDDGTGDALFEPPPPPPPPPPPQPDDPKDEHDELLLLLLLFSLDSDTGDGVPSA